MKNLMKLVSVMGCLFALSFAQAANYSIPGDLNGNKPGDANLLGVDVIDATGTPTGQYGLAAPVYLHWVIISSVVAAGYATLRDSGTLNSTSDVALTVSNAAGSTTQTITFNPPVIFRNGMSITLNAAATAPGRWMFGYRRRLDAKIGADPTQGTSASD